MLRPHLHRPLLALLAATALGAQDRPRVGLVLSGGGARGIAHVGVLEVLEELRVPIDCIAGTSMGAIVGGFYAYGLSPETMKRHLVRDDLHRDWQFLLDDEPDRRHKPFRRREDDSDFLVDFDIGFRDFGFVLPKGLSQGQNLDLELRFLGIEAHRLESFDALPIPFRAVATDIGSGRPVVLSRGNLPAAIRASMSVPGAFAPVRLDGRELIDGGIVDNLPVELARAMGADVLVVVDIGSPLLDVEEIGSLLGVAEQMVGILTQQNIDRSLRSLGDDDVVIRPELEDITVSDFGAAARAIELGRRGARAAAESLRRLAVSPDEYRAFRQRQRRVPAAPPVVQRITFEHDSRLADDYLIARLRTREGERLDAEQLRRDLEHLFGLGAFERVTFELVPLGPGAAELHIEAAAKSWGPSYVNFGLQVSDDFEGSTSYRIGAQYTMRELNAYGGEWRTQLSIGSERGLGTELYQPVEPSGTLFVAPRLLAQRFPARIFQNGRLVAEIEAQGAGFGLDVGSRLGLFGELRAGFERVFAEGQVELTSTGLPDVDIDDARLFVTVAIDDLDAPLFAREGRFLRSEWAIGFADLGADDDYQIARLACGQAFGNRRFGGVLFGRVETALEGSFPLVDVPVLGGLFNVSGLEPGAVAGDHVAFAALATYVQLNDDVPALLHVPTYIGVTLELGIAANRRSRMFSDPIAAASLTLGLDTFVGPILVGIGHAEGGRSSGHLSIGFTF